MDEFILRIPASTSNLGSGFDAFGLALPLYLTIKARRLAAGRDEFSFAGEVPSGAVDGNNGDNLFCRTFRRGLAVFGAGGQRPGYRFEIYNAIPLQRGLGSSGACVVGALLAALLVGGRLTVTDEQLLALAREIEGHADNVTPALHGGFTISLAAGEEFYSRHYPVLPALQVLVVIPELRLATAESRRVLPKTVPLAAAGENVARAALLVTALLLGDLTVLRPAVGDRLHQPYREKLLPYLAPLTALSYEHGSLATFLSGSGSALICLLQGDGRQLGTRLCQALKTDFALEAAYRLLTPANDGALVGTPAGGEVPWREARDWLAGQGWRA
ncbi:MAG: homoserine kinase [Deltaproteobacteria bacterium]|nr:homoserine kinase [Deltaproteobacteria bacterium]